MITPDDVAANPLEGIHDLGLLYYDPRSGGPYRGYSLRRDIEGLKSWTRPISRIDPSAISEEYLRRNLPR